MQKVSVLIVTMDRRDFIEKCLYCLCETSDSEITKIYVVDNASSDDTPDFLASMKIWQPRINVMRSEVNIGTEARHKLLPIIDTPYVLALDDDCWISTKGWDKGMIECFDGDARLGGLQIGGINDERNQYGVIWQGISYNRFSKPRFRCENIIGMYQATQKQIDGIDDRHRKCSNKIGNHWILEDNRGIPFSFSGCATMFRTEVLKDYKWESHSGLMSDLAGEWGIHTKNKGLYLAMTHEYITYHATGAWWHIGREEKCWRNKSQQSPIIYERPESQQWSFLEQAKKWSGWGSGIPDINDLLKGK